jgi:elongation factor G
MPNQTQNLCNVALAGHAGAGKTTLAEALLFAAGAIRAKGSVARGSTVCDFDPLEKRQQHSLDASLCGFEVHGRRVTLLDTPGLPDFVGRSVSVLAGVESAAIVVNASTGVEPMTTRMMHEARERGLCRFVVVNRIDARDARPEAVLAQLREAFGRECLPLNLPAGRGTAVVDCYFQSEGPAADFGSVAAAHEAIVDQVVEVDEALMTRHLEQSGSVTLEQLHDAFEQALREGHLIPVCFVSAETGAGVAELLRVLTELAPSPLEGNPPQFLEGEGAEAVPFAVKPDAGLHVVAHVFKVTIDPYVGKIGLFRVHQGTIRPGQQLFVGDARKPFRVTQLFRLQGKEQQPLALAGPGEICGIAKVDELHFDAVLHDSHDEDHLHLKSVRFPPAMLGVAIQPEKRGDEQRLADTLHKLVDEDPCVRVEHHAALNETVLYGMGELHVRLLLERMTERFGVAVKTQPPRVPYRETVTRAAEALYRHKKQTGGAGQFGEVKLRVEPLSRGAGFEFVDAVVGGAIPGQFIPAVEKGVRQVLAEGVVAGFEMQDLRVTVLDGKHHPVDSKEVAFVTAARHAFEDAAAQAGAVVLEPIVRAEINVPSSAVGDVTADLVTRRGRVTGQSSLPGGRLALTALAPLAELTDYPMRLKSLTAGEGSYTLDLSHYETVPPRRQQELSGAWQKHAHPA